MSEELASAVRDLAASIRELAKVVARDGAPRALEVAVAPAAQPLTAAQPAQPQAAPPRVEARLDPLAEAHEVLAEAFRLASLLEDTEPAFEAFLGLYHTERITPPRAVPTLREFAWRSLRRRVTDYLSEPGNPTSYTLARTDPAGVLPAQITAFRFFVNARGRSPPPVAFKRDPDQQGRLRLTDSSL